MGIPARPLPTYLARRYHGWKATDHAENAAWYRRLADEGQRRGRWWCHAATAGST